MQVWFTEPHLCRVDKGSKSDSTGRHRLEVTANTMVLLSALGYALDRRQCKGCQTPLSVLLAVAIAAVPPRTDRLISNFHRRGA